MKNIYIYPYSEDEAYARYILDQLVRYDLLTARYCGALDDNSPTPLHQAPLSDDTLVLISCFDNALRKLLFKKAANYKPLDFTTFVAGILHNALNNDGENEFLSGAKNLQNDKLLELAFYFIAFFKNKSKNYKALEHLLERKIAILNEYYTKKYGKIDVLYSVNYKLENKHSGKICEYLKSLGINAKYFVPKYDSMPRPMDKNAIIEPFFNIYNANFYKIMVVNSYTLMSLKSSGYKIGAPHAFVDPILGLYCSRNPLKPSFFSKLSRAKNLSAAASSKSNYILLKEGFKGRIFKGGYVSFDLLKPAPKQLDDKILVAINNTDRLLSIKTELINLTKYFKIIIRFHPGQKAPQIANRIKAALPPSPTLFYDEHSDVQNELTIGAIACISDTSSLSYTYAISFKRPVILFMPDYDLHTYKGVSFYDKRLHIEYKKGDDLSEAIQKAKDFDTTSIDEYIKDEIYNFGCASKVIAEYIAKKLKRLNTK